ncbi:MAG: serpin family protein, partial [Gemmatimonadota bacterium]
MSRLRVLLLSAVASCGLFTDPAPSGPPAQLTGLPRVLTADEVRVSGAANQFALALFKRLNAAQPAENVFVSPLSVSFALGMTMNGANGTTFDEMRSTLGFGADELTAINAGYRGLLSLESGLDASTTFRIANSVWHRQTLPVMPTFVDAMRQTFDADVRASPFDASTLTAVNRWVSQKTAGKIPTILEQISPNDVMFLVNAIYFKGSWRDRFDPKRTTDGSFAAVGGAQQVPMMHRPDGEGRLRFHWTPAATVGELSYGNGAFVMSIVMPQGDVDAFVATLDTASWRALLAPMLQADYAVRLPKFKLEYKRELKDDLKALGMQTPFLGGAADFTRMSTAGKQLFIAFVQHKTFVDVNEEGTEAAAVTNVGMGIVSAPPCLCVDRPFIFAIRERFSGTILFMG